MSAKEPNIPERWHGSHHYSNKLNLFFVFFLIFTALSLLWFYFEVNKIADIASKVKSPTPSTTKSPVPTDEQVFCTMEAKLCPDGINYVGRGGPNCDFAACPGQHCGGNIKNAAICSSGFHCQLIQSNPDTGGICVSNNPSPTPTCVPRPKCLDSKPKCLIAETADMCPPPQSP